MFDNFLSACVSLLDSFIIAMLLEIIKWLILYIRNKNKMKKALFNIYGYWIAIHEDKIGNILYKTKELVYITSERQGISIKIYQEVNDGRKYVYEGAGIAKFNKIVCFYEDVTNHKTNCVGGFMLKLKNNKEHSIMLAGEYFEFKKDGYHLVKRPYELEEYKMKFVDRLHMIFQTEKYAFKLLEEGEND